MLRREKKRRDGLKNGNKPPIDAIVRTNAKLRRGNKKKKVARTSPKKKGNRLGKNRFSATGKKKKVAKEIIGEGAPQSTVEARQIHDR